MVSPDTDHILRIFPRWWTQSQQYLLDVPVIVRSNGATSTILLSWDASLYKAGSGDIRWCHFVSPIPSRKYQHKGSIWTRSTWELHILRQWIQNPKKITTVIFWSNGPNAMQRVIQSLGSPMLRKVVADFGRGELAQSAVRFEAVDYSLEEATESRGRVTGWGVTPWLYLSRWASDYIVITDIYIYN